MRSPDARTQLATGHTANPTLPFRGASRIRSPLHRLTRRRVGCALARLALVSGALLFPLAVRAQAGNTAEAALNRALDLEGANKCREAIPLYRQAAQVPDPTGAILGLERCYSMVGRPDSILALLDTVLVRKPSDPTLRTVQLRTLATVRREADLSTAFTQWVALAPKDPTPYRVMAQLMLDQGRAKAADSVLQAAATALGGAKALASEFAQMQAALGMWVPSARSWRAAGEALSYMEQAAVFSLMAAPVATRDSVRAIFTEAPVTLGARRMLSGLELKWHAPRDAWRVLSELPANDSTVNTWIAFARDAEGEQSWLTARDAYAQASRARPSDRKLAIRAATAALAGGDPRSALDIVRTLPSGADSTTATVLLLEVQALGAMGRAASADSLLNVKGKGLDPAAARLAQRAMAWAWIRSGDLARANVALDSAGRDTDEGDRVAAWIALYTGDLKTARRGLRRTDEPSNDVVAAMALLSRTRTDSSPAVGRAFLTLARGDTAMAAREFEQVAGQITDDASSFLSGTAARLFLASRDTSRAIELWQMILTRHVEAPEAAESDLAWARVLRARGDSAGAVQKLEHLILTYSRSALVPQARRELDLVRGAVPPGGAGFAMIAVARREPAMRLSV